MIQKKVDNRMELIERKMEEWEGEMQRLLGLEKSIEQLTQSMAKMLQSMEETRRAMTVLSNPKNYLNRSKEGDGTSSSCEKAMQHNKLEKSIENHCIVEKGKWPGRVGEESYGKSTVTMPQNREEDAGGGCENWKCSFSAGKIWMDGCSE